MLSRSGCPSAASSTRRPPAWSSPPMPGARPPASSGAGLVRSSWPGWLPSSGNDGRRGVQRECHGAGTRKHARIGPAACETRHSCTLHRAGCTVSCTPTPDECPPPDRSRICLWLGWSPWPRHAQSTCCSRTWRSPAGRAGSPRASPRLFDTSPRASRRGALLALPRGCPEVSGVSGGRGVYPSGFGRAGHGSLCGRIQATSCAAVTAQPTAVA